MENAKVEASLKNQSARVILNAVQSNCILCIKYGFKTWKEKTADYGHRDRCVRSLV